MGCQVALAPVRVGGYLERASLRRAGLGAEGRVAHRALAGCHSALLLVGDPGLGRRRVEVDLAKTGARVRGVVDQLTFTGFHGFSRVFSGSHRFCTGPPWENRYLTVFDGRLGVFDRV